VQEADSRVERALLESGVFEGHSEALAVQCEGESSFIHIQEDPQHSLPLERLAVHWPDSI